MCYPQQKVIVELDSWTHHGDREAFERDRARDSITTAAGFRTVRLTAERMTGAEADRLRAMLTV
jgi:very-short-patch-repair endonuclease